MNPMDGGRRQLSVVFALCSWARMADRIVRHVYQFETLRQHAEVRCRACGWRVIFPPEGMKLLFNPLLPLRHAEARLRCQRCGKRAAALRALYREYHG